MKLTLVQKIVILIDILLLAALPFIASQGMVPAMPKTQTSLTEAYLPAVAEFKTYEEKTQISLNTEHVSTAVKQADQSMVAAENVPQAQKVLVAGESIGVGIVEEIVIPSTTPIPEPQPEIPKSLSDEAIIFLGNCESGMTPTRNSGNGYYGAFQFSIGTWNSMETGYTRADLAPLEVQIDAVQRLVARSNIYGQFPACAQKMKSAGLI